MRLFNSVILFALCLLAYFTYFQRDVNNTQQVTRMALAIAFSEGRLDLAPFENNTVDKAVHDGRTYADKPPGLSLLATPAVLALRAVRAALGQPVDIRNADDYALLTRVAAASTVALFSALAVAALYLALPKLGLTPGAALFAATALGFGTPFFGWSTTFFVHAPSGCVILLALGLAHFRRRTPSPGSDLLLGFVLGFLLSIDLTALPAAIAIGLYALSANRSRLLGRLAALILGGVAGVSPLLAHNALAFGSPLRFGYGEVVGFAGMKTGFFGLNQPDPAVLLQILFGLHRGLLPLSPVLLLVPVGFLGLWRQRDLRGLALTIGVIAASALLINSSYFYWDGGSSTGPRHLVAMLPVLAVPLGFAWPKRRPGQWGAMALLAVSLVLSLACASTGMFADIRFPSPLFDVVLPLAFSAEGLRIMLGMLVPWLGVLLIAWRDRTSAAQRHPLPA